MTVPTFSWSQGLARCNHQNVGLDMAVFDSEQVWLDIVDLAGNENNSRIGNSKINTLLSTVLVNSELYTGLTQPRCVAI